MFLSVHKPYPEKINSSVWYQIRLDEEFGEMITEIYRYKDKLQKRENRIPALRSNSQKKREDLITSERKLVVIKEAQQAVL